MHFKVLFCCDIIELNQKQGDVTLSPKDVNELFNIMQLNSFDKRKCEDLSTKQEAIYQPINLPLNEPKTFRNPPSYQSLSKSKNSKTCINESNSAPHFEVGFDEAPQTTFLNLEKLIHNLKTSLISEQLTNMQKSLSSLYNTKLMTIKAEYEVGEPLTCSPSSWSWTTTCSTHSAHLTKWHRAKISKCIAHLSILSICRSKLRKSDRILIEVTLDFISVDGLAQAHEVIHKNRRIMQEVEDLLASKPCDLDLPDIKLGCKLIANIEHQKTSKFYRLCCRPEIVERKRYLCLSKVSL